jgi:hypothetical protein
MFSGRTNPPAYSMRIYSDNDLQVRSHNPCDRGTAPGGSWGGAADLPPAFDAELSLEANAACFPGRVREDLAHDAAEVIEAAEGVVAPIDPAW